MGHLSAVLGVVVLLGLVGWSFSLWPQPASVRLGGDTLWVNTHGVHVQLPPGASEVLVEAARRYINGERNLFFPFGLTQPADGALQLAVAIAVADGGRTANLSLGIDESYTLTVVHTKTEISAQIKSGTVFGAIYGLETLSQLIQWDSDAETYLIDSLPLAITDTPRFPWRGLLIDTSRHYLHPSTIKNAIDVLAYNKYNVLHWHVIDSQSFPLESKTYPNLIEGAYNKRAIYTAETVRDITQYGLYRGVRVIPEFEMPGHAAAFGYGYPELVAKCPNYSDDMNNVALDVSNDTTYEFLNSFLKEMSGLFSDDFFHLGGDEVVFQCWFDDERIAKWAASKGFTNGAQIEEYFEQKLQTMVLPGNNNQINKGIIVWEEIFQNGITLRKDVVVQVWSSRSLLQKVLDAGHRTLLSQGFYLDVQVPDPGRVWYKWGDTWKNFYLNEPLNGLKITPDQEKLILGGEAAMWGEQVDDTNFESRVWPRACGTSERLWSNKSVSDVDAAEPRLNAFRCHLARRGVGAGPVMPDFCELPSYRGLGGRL